MLDEQSKHVAYIVRHALDNERHDGRGRRRRPRTAWVQTIIELARSTTSSSSRARPATTTTRASPASAASSNGFYGAGSVAFIKVIADWRAEGDLPGMALTPGRLSTRFVRILVARATTIRTKTV